MKPCPFIAILTVLPLTLTLAAGESEFSLLLNQEKLPNVRLFKDFPTQGPLIFSSEEPVEISSIPVQDHPTKKTP